MRLGLLGARADRRGLATMCTEFARHMKPQRVLGIDMPGVRGDWSDYDPQALEVFKLRELTDANVSRFFDGLDVCYLAETDYHPHRPKGRYITALAQDAGCKLVLHAMPEMCRFAIGSPNLDPKEPPPDLIVLPTTWMADAFPGSIVLPFPVNRKLLPPVRRTEARGFLHVVGKPAMQDRAGTDIVRAACGKTEAVVHIAIQKGTQGTDRPDYHTIYPDFDVLLAPRRYGGQSLPLMEAASSGMPVVALDRCPESGWLPSTSLLPVTKRRSVRMMGGAVEVCDSDPMTMAAMIDHLAGSPQLVAELSERSCELAAEHSWEVLGPRWRELLESV